MRINLKTELPNPLETQNPPQQRKMLLVAHMSFSRLQVSQTLQDDRIIPMICYRERQRDTAPAVLKAKSF